MFQTHSSEFESNGYQILVRVNSETRKLIKRSSRAGDLKKRFKVEEMSSISTLEVAWEHYPWGTYDHEVEARWTKHFSAGKLLERINSSCSSGYERRKSVSGMKRRFQSAARQGNLEMVKYCVANECPIDEWACANAAEGGHLECLKYLHEEAKAPWDWRSAAWAAANGHLHILEYLVERKYDKYDAYACEYAAENGNLDCLKYLHETAKAPWNYWRRTSSAREQTSRLCTIPPRQRLSITRRLAIRRRNIIRLGIIDEEFRTARASEKKEKPVYRNTRSRETNT